LFVFVVLPGGDQEAQAGQIVGRRWGVCGGKSKEKDKYHAMQHDRVAIRWGVRQKGEREDDTSR